MLEAKRNNSGEKAIMDAGEGEKGGSGKEWQRPFIGASMGVPKLEGGQLGVG